jgi:hypothetical protein
MMNLKHYNRLLHIPLFGLIIEQFLSAETKNENHLVICSTLCIPLGPTALGDNTARPNLSTPLDVNNLA